MVYDFFPDKADDAPQHGSGRHKGDPRGQAQCGGQHAQQQGHAAHRQGVRHLRAHMLQVVATARQ